MIFKDRTGTNLNRKKITIISQTPTEIIADIERADNPIEEGTTINASVFNSFQDNINTAIDTANSALESSNTATTTANSAKTNSTSALNIAGKASYDATNAIEAANEAITSANNVTTIANQALDTANTASQNATNALNCVNDALTNSQTAQDLANSAQTSANSASTKADEAKTLATTANATANSALTTANAAQNKADTIDSSLTTFKSSYLLSVYPVGAIYISVNSTSPASLFGGTWQQLKDRFLIGAGGSYSVNGTGGATTHSHTLNNGYAKILYNWQNNDNKLMYKTKDGVSYTTDANTNTDAGYNFNNFSQSRATALGGNTDSSSNIPPYLAVYMWKRTA